MSEKTKSPFKRLFVHEGKPYTSNADFQQAAGDSDTSISHIDGDSQSFSHVVVGADGRKTLAPVTGRPELAKLITDQDSDPKPL